MLRQGSAIALVLVGILLGAGVVAGLTVGQAASRTAPGQASASPSPEAAIAAFLTDHETYAGPCEQTRSPEHLGMLCSRFVEEQGGIRAYLLGRTFSEFERWLFVAAVASGWTVIGSTPLDFYAVPMRIPWPR